TVLQGPQAKPQNQDFRGHHRERPAHPDLDSLDRHAAAQVAPSPLQSQLVAVQSGHHAALEPVYLPGFTRLATQSVRNSAHFPSRGTAPTRTGMTWTGTDSKNKDLIPNRRSTLSQSL